MIPKFRYLLVVIFLLSITLIVFLQFNSNKSINQLISGNKDLMGFQRVKRELQNLQKNVLAVDAGTRAEVIKGTVSNAHRKHTEIDVKHIESSLNIIDSLETDPAVANLQTELRGLVNQKIAINRLIIETLNEKGKEAAEKLAANPRSAVVADSIRLLAKEIDDKQSVNVKLSIDEANKDGQTAKALGTILALIAAMASVFIFGYITYKMLDQQRLIGRLNESESKARESARIKENFLANMSHEIRTPLNAIIGFTNLLKRRELDEEAGKYVSYIQKAGDGLLHIVNDILDLSKLEAGMMRIDSEPFHPREILQSVFDIYEPKAIDKGITLHIGTDQAVPLVLTGDAARFSQILSNLIVNALKFTEKGTVDIQIDKLSETADEVVLLTTISDTGIGVHPKEVNAIFERFHQADEASTRRYGGTGLGLSIVRDLVKTMNGKITVESEEGKGSRFFLELPFKKNDIPGTPAISQMPENSNRKRHGSKVLVVEDNEINQMLVTKLLLTRGIESEVANDGATALSMLKERNYDLILMDIQMPGMDGYTTTRIIRSELGSKIPIIAMTAHAMAREKEKCILSGMNDYLAKPVDETALFNMLSQYLSDPEEGLKNLSDTQHKSDYKTIQLDYLFSISQGDKEYERSVTDQFLTSLPQELELMEKAVDDGNPGELKSLAHHMKSTISIMGLDDKLKTLLDDIEMGLPQEALPERMATLDRISQDALREAKIFLDSISG
jgi:signal transduction histidine kinase/CheY-like chemotaxis protein